jgi:hypothetical protein
MNKFEEALQYAKTPAQKDQVGADGNGRVRVRGR